MLDWSNIFNIVFVAASLALTVFLLISTIAVAVKGKRKCNAFDVILRIVASVIMLVSAAMTVGAGLTLTGGSLRIDVFGAEADSVAASFVIGGTVIELPLAIVFVALSTSIGLMLSALLFICSITALIVDCLVANKKEQKADKAEKTKQVKKSKQPQKTAAQLKLEADLEHIRKLGESALSKTNAAVQHAETATARREQEKEQEQEKESDSITNENESATDWRTEIKTDNGTSQNTEFVGIKQTDDSDFDSFDGFDEPAETETDEPIESDEQEDSDGQIESEEQTAYEEDFADVFTDDQTESDSDVDEQDKTDDMSAWAYDEDEVNESDISVDEPNSNEDKIFDETPVDGAVDKMPIDSGNELAAHRKGEYENIEPNRDIYIPDIRTIVKQNERTEERRPSAQTRQRTTANKKKSGTSKSADKPNAVKTSTNKKTSKSTADKTSARKTGARDIASEKKLPLTRRYVILDRQNAVNMFGEYLKERDRTAKDKLQSSINTIIIE